MQPPARIGNARAIQETATLTAQHPDPMTKTVGQPTLSLVVPVYQDATAVPHFFQVVVPILKDTGVDWEIVCVDDGSTDESLDALCAQQQKDPRIKVIALSRNFGKEAALTAGLAHTNGQAVVPIDVDLQDPPHLIGEMLVRWRAGYDVVHAVRRQRDSDSWFKRASARLFYNAYNRLSHIRIPVNAGDFRLVDRKVVDALSQFPERNRFAKGLFAWLGFRQTYVTYARQRRITGKTNWSYWKLWNFALDGITSFSTLPLRVWSYIGVSIAFLSFFYAIFLIVRTLLYGIDVPGYASLMVVVLFLGGLQLLTLGILGEYLGRTYQETKARPIYLVRATYGFGANDDPPSR